MFNSSVIKGLLPPVGFFALIAAVLSGVDAYLVGARQACKPGVDAGGGCPIRAWLDARSRMAFEPLECWLMATRHTAVYTAFALVPWRRAGHHAPCGSSVCVWMLRSLPVMWWRSQLSLSQIPPTSRGHTGLPVTPGAGKRTANAQRLGAEGVGVGGG